ncbi:MAG: ribonuclease R [Bacteroidia bacterium]|nr:ribonuclease R [Bacteroidia bacterium]
MTKKKKDKKRRQAEISFALARKDSLNFLKKAPHRFFNNKQIASGANLRGQISHKKLVGLLEDMAEKGILETDGRGKFRFLFKSTDVVGSIDITRDGVGFVLIEGTDKEIFIRPSETGKSMPGDKVKVQVTKPSVRGNKAEGRVIEIVERAKTRFVGTVKMDGDIAFLVPDDHKMTTDFHIPKGERGGAKNGEKAVVELISWERRSPDARVVRVLGAPGENETEMHAILFQYGFDPKFPEGVEAEAESISKKIPAAEIKKRRDLRDTLTFTIDPVDAKDFDDALSFKKLENGHFEVGVHIADVTHYLKPGSEMDKEAQERATSVYLVDRTVPMLPEALSNFLCSLRPNEDKLTFSCVWELDANGKIHQEWIGKTVIHSDRRFDYLEAQELIDKGPDDQYREALQILNKIAYKLRAKRFKKGSLGFEDQEMKFELDENGKPIRAYIKRRVDTHKLIEDFMLLANQQVTVFVSRLRKDPPLPFVYRIHDTPDLDKLTRLREFVANFGYDLDLSSAKSTTASLHKLVTDVDGKPEQRVVQTVAIRTMAKAVYSIDNIGHYGLAFTHYTHFTSPIRRYPDVMVHRLLFKYLNHEFTANPGELERQCKHSSNMEKKATEAERASVKYKQVEFLEDKIGQEFQALISGVTKWGVFAEITENGCEGMIRLADIEWDYYEYIEEKYCIRGRRTGHEIHLGDKVIIKVRETNLFKREIDFDLVDHIQEKFHGAAELSFE